MPPSYHPSCTRGRGVAILLLLGVLCLGRLGVTQHLENDLSLLHDLDVNNGVSYNPDDDFEVEIFYKPDGEDRVVKSPSAPSSGSEDVRRLWGVADTEATIGRLFSYPIPSDAFSGNVESYQVKGLPGWLVWEAAKGAVEGVPGGGDRGHHYVTIRAVGYDGHHAKDVFAVLVKEAPAWSVRREAGCKGKEDLTTLSVALDVTLHSLTPTVRVALIRAAQRFLGVKEVSLTAAPHNSDPLSEDTAILAGPGSSSKARRGTAGYTLLQWAVGCGGEVSRVGQDLVERVEGAASSGDLERALSVPVFSWHVTQTHPRTKRVRRQAESSGDNENYDAYSNYDYEYDYEYDGDEEYLSAYDLEPEPEPESRIVPPLATPVFPDAPATVRPAPDRSSGAEDGSPHLHFTPVLVSTPVFVPVKPTRMVVEASPTVTYQTASPYLPPGPSETPHIQGSFTTHPSLSAETTTPLVVPTHSTLTPTRPLDSSAGVEVTTEISIKNFPPRVSNRIQKLAWIAGHVYRLAIPQDTFMDMEDGNTRELRLLFKTAQGLTVGRNSWIQFNPTEQYIYALPLEEHIGRYTYLLEALDSEGKSTTDSIMIHVQQPKQARNFNHRFVATFSIQKKYEYDFVYSLDWQVNAVEKVASVYGDATTDLINVRAISTNPTKLTWTNTSLTNPSSNTCPIEELDMLSEVVLGRSEHEATREVKRAFEPEFILKRIHLHYLGPCHHHPRHSQPPPPSPGHTDGDTSRMGVVVNMPPIIRNQIDFLNATQGSLFRFKVPVDTCYDAEDGDSWRLKMRLLTSHLSPPPNTSWLQFDPANHEFFGIPLADDVGKTEYILECVDKAGEKINDALFVNVLRRGSSTLPPVQFSLTVTDKYSDFLGQPHRKARLVDRIGEAFGDDDAHNVAVESFRMGSVVVTWHNSSLPAEPCPNTQIQQLRDRMVTEEGDLNPEFVEFFGTEFPVVAGSVNPTGSCLGEITPFHVEEEVHHPPVDQEVEGGRDNDYLLNFIIPAVIIAAMLLLAAVIACCLYRRRRYGKMTMADDRTFVSKGIPIIFAEELDDRPDPAKSPVIMKEEKPPLPPPEYQRGNSPASAPTPPAADRRRRPHSGDVPDDAPSYQPPPPFTATNGASRHPRPNMPPTYRKPPTYVPP